MKLKSNEEVAALPKDIDVECIGICNLLNSLPGTCTFESCCGHGREPFSVWFFCDDIDTISRLGRAVNKNYSDGQWQIVVDSTDTRPRGVFWLRSIKPLSGTELTNSVGALMINIHHWFSAQFDIYFASF